MYRHSLPNFFNLRYFFLLVIVFITVTQLPVIELYVTWSNRKTNSPFYCHLRCSAMTDLVTIYYRLEFWPYFVRSKKYTQHAVTCCLYLERRFLFPLEHCSAVQEGAIMGSVSSNNDLKVQLKLYNWII